MLFFYCAHRIVPFQKALAHRTPLNTIDLIISLLDSFISGVIGLEFFDVYFGKSNQIGIFEIQVCSGLSKSL